MNWVSTRDQKPKYKQPIRVKWADGTESIGFGGIDCIIVDGCSFFCDLIWRLEDSGTNDIHDTKRTSLDKTKS